MYNMPVVDIYNQKLCDPLFPSLKARTIHKKTSSGITSIVLSATWLVSKQEKNPIQKARAGRETIFSYPNR